MREQLSPELTSISAARNIVADALQDFPSDFRAEAILVASELVTNAVVHAHTPVTLGITVKNRCVLIEVDDDSPVSPELLNNDADDIHGRGLHIVDALSQSCGVTHRPNDGKCVWAKMKSRT